MEGRAHDGVLWVLTSRGDTPALCADDWDRWYVEQRMPEVLASGAAAAGVRFRLASGFELPHGATHAVIYEILGTPLSEARAALAASASGGPFPEALEDVSAFAQHSRTGDVGARRTNGIVAVFTDCDDPAQEPAFDDWYEQHAQHVVDNMDHHAVTRYTSAPGSGALSKHLAIYETEADEPGRVQREGLAWYLESEHVANTPSFLVARSEVALERV